MRDIEQGARLELVVGTLGYNLSGNDFQGLFYVRDDLHVDMALFWMIWKPGLEDVVASGLSAVGADLANSLSIVENVKRYKPPFAYNTTAVVCFFNSTYMGACSS